MLSLDSPQWSKLSDAYGSATEIPSLLKDLMSCPPDEGSEAEPYFSLWSALCHQGDIYTASYAAVPHLVAAINANPKKMPWTVFQMIACIEIARANGRGPTIPEEMQQAYTESLEQIPRLVAESATPEWDHWRCGAALAAIAASKGFPKFAEAIFELDPDTVDEILRAKFGE